MPDDQRRRSLTRPLRDLEDAELYALDRLPHLISYLKDEIGDPLFVLSTLASDELTFRGMS